MKKENKYRLSVIRIFLLLVFVIVIVVLVFSNAIINGIFSISDSFYIIPKESSYNSFESTLMNEGSGGWWIYGKDDSKYYFFSGDEEKPYVFIDRDKAKTIEDFNPHDIATWQLKKEVREKSVRGGSP